MHSVKTPTKSAKRNLNNSLLSAEKTKDENHDQVQISKRKPLVKVAMNKIKTSLSLTAKGASPSNWKVIFLVFISLFSSSFNITFLFPFLPEMILMFGYKEEEKGYYAGIVASALFVGRAFGSYFWGWLSDRKGRKPVMLITVLLNGVSSLAFGFTTNIYFAVITRLLSGLVNGTVGTAKTILYEVSDNTNQAVGMSIISVAWGSGIIAGPAVGGYLANPCKRYPNIFPSQGFFYKFPYIFPGLFSFVLCLIPFILDFILLPETLQYKTNKEIEIEAPEPADDITILHSAEPLNQHYKSVDYSNFQEHLHEDYNDTMLSVSTENLHVVTEGEAYLAGSREEIQMTGRQIEFRDIHDDKDAFKKDSIQLANFQREISEDQESDTYCKEVSIDNHNVLGNEVSQKLIYEKPRQETVHNEEQEIELQHRLNKCGHKNSSFCNTLRNLSFVKLIRQYDVFVAVSLYSLSSFGVIGVEEIFTVWASTDIMLDGLGFQPNEIGSVLGITALPLLFLQLFIFPHLIRRLGIRKTLVSCVTLQMICTQCLPCLHLLINRLALLWTLLIINITVMKLMSSCVFSSTGLLINNSVRPELAGQVNGLAMTLTASARSLAPLIGGSLYSWTVGYAAFTIGPPFDVSFVFMIFGLVYWVVAIEGISIPERLNQQKK